MTVGSGPSDGASRLVQPMLGRSPSESHRAATPLELFFDLVFVVAVARAAAGLHHAIGAGHIADGVTSYAIVFFAIWWAWMNFTWFASAYDTDDVPYRIVVFVQLAGALILAAGVEDAFARGDFRVVTGGYVVMRLALVFQWVRAGLTDAARRACAFRYAAGVAACQAAWVGRLWLPPEYAMPSILILIACELLVPTWAERGARTAWHPGHIAERYGLFTIIVLGESVLAASDAIGAALGESTLTPHLMSIFGGGVLIVFAMWWLYFERSAEDVLTSLRNAFIWGYGHYFVFAAAAAVGSGIAVATEEATHGGGLGSTQVGLAVAVPVAIYLVVLWKLHGHPHGERGRHAALMLGTAALVLATAVTGHAPLLTGLLLSGLVAVRVAAGTATLAT